VNEINADGLETLLETAAKAESEEERSLRQLIKDLMVEKIDRGEGYGNLARSYGNLFLQGATLVAKLFPDSSVAERLPSVASNFEERMKLRLMNRYRQIEGFIDNMSVTELFHLVRSLLERVPLDELFTSLEITQMTAQSKAKSLRLNSR
jgi:nucleotidyltransferase/DNA polymerase involved in DNA repair